MALHTGLPIGASRPSPGCQVCEVQHEWTNPTPDLPAEAGENPRGHWVRRPENPSLRDPPAMPV